MAQVINPRNRYYCHQCMREVIPITDFTCPHCHSGFIEELPENQPPAISTTQQNSGNHAATPILFNLFQNFFPHASHNAPLPNVTSVPHTSTNPSQGPVQIRHHYPPLRTSNAPPPTAVFDLEGLLQQILSWVDSDNTVFRMEPGGVVFIEYDYPGSGGGGRHFHANTASGGFPNIFGNLRDYAWGPGALEAIMEQLFNQIEGQGVPPSSPQTIDKLPTAVIDEYDIKQELQCSVCMEYFKIKEKVKALPCEHLFHKDCIIPWLNLHGTCPICRKPVGPESKTSGEETQPLNIPLTTTNSNASSNNAMGGRSNSATPRVQIPLYPNTNTNRHPTPYHRSFSMQTGPSNTNYNNQPSRFTSDAPFTRYRYYYNVNPPPPQQGNAMQNANQSSPHQNNTTRENNSSVRPGLHHHILPSYVRRFSDGIDTNQHRRAPNEEEFHPDSNYNHHTSQSIPVRIIRTNEFERSNHRPARPPPPSFLSDANQHNTRNEPISFVVPPLRNPESSSIHNNNPQHNHHRRPVQSEPAQSTNQDPNNNPNDITQNVTKSNENPVSKGVRPRNESTSSESHKVNSSSNFSTENVTTNPNKPDDNKNSGKRFKLMDLDID